MIDIMTKAPLGMVADSPTRDQPSSFLLASSYRIIGASRPASLPHPIQNDAPFNDRRGGRIARLGRFHLAGMPHVSVCPETRAKAPVCPPFPLPSHHRTPRRPPQFSSIISNSHHLLPISSCSQGRERINASKVGGGSLVGGIIQKIPPCPPFYKGGISWRQG